MKPKYNLLPKVQLVSMDFAIKNLLRDKCDFDVVSSFLSAVLVACGGPEVEVVSTQESELNKTSPHLASTIVDVIVKDKKNNQYLVEVERGCTPDFVHKSIFNTSKLLVQTAKVTKIKKIYHLTILYKPHKFIKDFLYKSNVVIKDIINKNDLMCGLGVKSKDIYKAEKLFPEHYFIALKNFNEEIKHGLNEWLYFLKNGTVDEKLMSNGVLKAYKKLDYLQMPDEAKSAYDRLIYLDEKEKDLKIEGIIEGLEEGEKIGTLKGLELGKAEGLELGKAEGEKLKQIEIAKNLLSLDVDIETIIKATFLSKEEIKKLIK